MKRALFSPFPLKRSRLIFTENVEYEFGKIKINRKISTGESKQQRAEEKREEKIEDKYNIEKEP